MKPPISIWQAEGDSFHWWNDLKVLSSYATVFCVI